MTYATANFALNFLLVNDAPTNPDMIYEEVDLTDALDCELVPFEQIENSLSFECYKAEYVAEGFFEPIHKCTYCGSSHMSYHGDDHAEVVCDDCLEDAETRFDVHQKELKRSATVKANRLDCLEAARPHLTLSQYTEYRLQITHGW